MNSPVRLLAVAAMLMVFAAVAISAQQDITPSKEDLEGAFPGRSYSPYADRNFPDRPLFGDTHLHTGASFDAGTFGNRLNAEHAYRLARGEEITATGGFRVKLSRPLDWLVVADHSENLGFFPRLLRGDPDIVSNEWGKRWHGMIQEGGQTAVEAAAEIIGMFAQGTFPIPVDEKAFRSAWQFQVDAAEKYNDPGTFSAIIGYEWTSTPKGFNLHRVVMFRDGADKTRDLLPYSALDSTNPEDLWKALQAYEDDTGGDVLAIAHNGNMSNGIMFSDKYYDGNRDIGPRYAQDRMKWEPVYEVTQIKGDGEAHPFLSPNDEFADYETWAVGNLDLTELKEDHMLQGEYAREALKKGLAFEQKFGENPYKFGLIGSTDAHTGLAAVQEDNFFGKHSGGEPTEGRIEHPMARVGDNEYPGWSMVASGLAVAWATENTREAIFDAFERKETYATTGSRLWVRFFGGWDFTAGDAGSRTPAALGYSKGVPMGADLMPARGQDAPTFLIAALKDPYGGNLDRMQIIKGWVDDEGETHERVYDVAVSDGRSINAEGRCTTPVGNTVDVKNATWTNSIGAAELITTWKDPDFDPDQRAFYYARVIEIPTPRWTAYDAKYFNLTVDPEIPMTTQDRAYTSPIWYTPPRTN